MGSSNRKLIGALAVCALLVFGAGSAALASHQFNDVPDSHIFHDEISAIGGAGITTGFPDGTFRPENNIPRQGMAAFFERGLGRVGYGESGGNALGTSSGNLSAVVGSVTIDAGAKSSGNGFVLLTGTVTADTGNENFCPCELSTQIQEPGSGAGLLHWFNVSGNATESAFASSNASVQWVVPINADTTRTFELVVNLHDADMSAISVWGELSAVYVPFGPDGDNTIDYGPTSLTSETESPAPNRSGS